MPEELEGGVVVVKKFPRGIGGAVFCGGIGEKNIGNAGEAGSVCEQMVDGDGFERGIDAEPGEIVDDGLLEVEFAFLVELQETICEKTFTDGADLEKLVGCDAEFLFDVTEAISDNALYAIAVCED
jgi:hypothetical protein